MAFSSGFLNKQVVIATRAEDQTNQFGKQGQARYQVFGPIWANVTYSKGQKRLEEAAMDSMNTRLFRCRYHDWIDEWCLIKYHGKWHQISSCDGSEERDEMQITAVQMSNQNITFVED